MIYIAMAALAAIITWLFIHPLSHDGMEKEDLEFREYLERHGFDTSRMGLLSTEEIKDLEVKVMEVNGEEGAPSIGERDPEKMLV